jgi:hypothetical protein
MPQDLTKRLVVLSFYDAVTVHDGNKTTRRATRNPGFDAADDFGNLDGIHRHAEDSEEKESALQISTVSGIRTL